MKIVLNKFIAGLLTAVFFLLMILCIRISKEYLLGEYLNKLFNLNFNINKVIIASLVLFSRYFSGVLCKKNNFEKLGKFIGLSFRILAYAVLITSVFLVF